METIKTLVLYKDLCSLLSQKKLKQGLELLFQLVEATSSGELTNEFDNIVSAYKSMLSYTIEGVSDPERDNVYIKLMKSTFKLADKSKQILLLRYSGWHSYWIKQQAEKEQRLTSHNIVETVDNLIFKAALDELLYPDLESENDPNSEKSLRHKQLIKNIFNHLWLTDYYSEVEENLIKIIFESGKFEWYETSLFTSAITLSLFRTWQPEKVKYLFYIYDMGMDQLSERAMAGLIINLHHYNERTLFYPEITSILKKRKSDDTFRERHILAALQVIRSKETEPLSNKLRDEIIPKMTKLRPHIEERLDLENILPSDIADGKNPDWGAMFNESEEIFKTMEEMTKLQMEGADIYMSAFSNLKNFDFFKEFHNWFMPFYPDHEVLNEVFNDAVLGPGTDELAEAMSITPFICNSDKFSLILYLKYLPSSQKTMMLKVFKMELEGLREMNDSDKKLTDPDNIFKINTTQYVQDLYRFFKLSPYKKEFEDIFNSRLDIYNSLFFNIICEKSDDYLLFADYFFNKNFFDDAKNILLKFIEENPENSQLYERIGYCYQETFDYTNALKYYQLAEIIDRKPWTLKKEGFCLRRLGKTEEALDYYLQSSELKPDNIHTTMMIGHCYLDLKEYETALTYYFKVEYNTPGNVKILRPIAYCFWALGRFDDSEKYYQRLSNDILNMHDYINIGHLKLCSGNKKEAVDCYRKSIDSGNISKERFYEIIEEDKDMLVSLGTDADELSLIVDYLFYSIE